MKTYYKVAAVNLIAQRWEKKIWWPSIIRFWGVYVICVDEIGCKRKICWCLCFLNWFVYFSLPCGIHISITWQETALSAGFTIHMTPGLQKGHFRSLQSSVHRLVTHTAPKHISDSWILFENWGCYIDLAPLKKDWFSLNCIRLHTVWLQFKMSWKTYWPLCVVKPRREIGSTKSGCNYHGKETIKAVFRSQNLPVRNT